MGRAVGAMVKKTSAILLGALVILLAGLVPAQQKTEQVPDAPSASQPPAPFPSKAPGDSSAPPSGSDTEQPAAAPSELKPPTQPPHSAPDEPAATTAPPPM